MKPAVFLDRDGTIIQDVHYLREPERVQLLPGAAEGLRLLRDAGYTLVVVSNQSAVGRGMLTLDGLRAIHDEFCRQLASAGSAIDAWYFCPEAPRSDDRTAIEHPDRKPAPGMLLRAAQEHGLDLAASWMIGDMVSDLLAGRNAGCRGAILVRTGYGATVTGSAGLADHVADDLLGAARWLLSEQARPGPGRPYRPGSARGPSSAV